MTDRDWGRVRAESAVLERWTARAVATAAADGIEGFPVAVMLPGPAHRWAKSLRWMVRAFKRHGFTLVFLDGVVWAEPTKSHEARKDRS